MSWIENHPIHPLFYLFCFAAAILLIAYRKGYFKLPHKKEDNSAMSFWMVFGAYAAYFGTAFVLIPVLVVLAVFAYTGHIPKDPKEYLTPVSTEWLTIATFIASTIAAVLFTFFAQPKITTLVWNRDRKGVASLTKDFLFGMFSWFVSFPLVSFVRQGVHEIVTFLVRHHQWTPEDQVVVRFLKEITVNQAMLKMAAIVVIFITPIGEEILFRGCLQTWFRKSLGSVGAIFLTSIFFTLSHYSASQGIANIELLSSLFVLSCFVGFIYERQRSLWAPIGLHLVFNAVSVVLIFAENL